MKHRNKHKQLGRDTGARNSLYKNLICNLFKFGYIQTTEAKAKVFKSICARFITKLLKQKNEHLTQYIKSNVYFSNKVAVDKIYEFYKLHQEKEKMSNYLRHQRVYNIQRNNENLILISFLS